MTKTVDSFEAKNTLSVGNQSYTYYRLQTLADKGIADVSKLPFSIRILLEAVLRQVDGHAVEEEHVRKLANWNAAAPEKIRDPIQTCAYSATGLYGCPGGR